MWINDPSSSIIISVYAISILPLLKTHVDSIILLFIEEVHDAVLRFGDWLNTLADSSELPIFIWKLCDSPMLYDQLFPSGVSAGPPTIRGESEDC